MRSRFIKALIAHLCLLAAACEPSGPRTDSQTHWLRTCSIDSECGDLSCLCGVCTRSCGDTATCTDLAGSACVGADESGSIALCGGVKPASPGLCVPRCDDSACAAGQRCVSGVCEPVPEPAATVTLDTAIRHQTLAGIGATLAYAENMIVEHPQKTALYDAIFTDLGLDIVRLRNHYGLPSEEDLTPAGEIVDEATQRLGRAPLVLLSSWSPPANLKASGALACLGNADTCTLARTPAGVFDYAGLATHWRASLEAYAAAGVQPDYFGIQNNPDWIPSSSVAEACKFLPAEGTRTVTVNGVAVDVEYPGFDEAVSAVLGALAGLPNAPQLLAPEVSGATAVTAYLDELDIADVDVIAHHLYGTDPADGDITRFESLAEVGQTYGRPLFQTEMEGDGFGTAVLMHDTLAIEGAAAYVQMALAGTDSEPTANATALTAIGADAFAVQDPYHAMRHYSLGTDPGWVRIEASSSMSTLLASGWVSPDGDALTVVLVNTGLQAVDVAIEPGETFASSTVTRTVFDGVERSAELGSLSSEAVVQVPVRAIVTVSLGN